MRVINESENILEMSKLIKPQADKSLGDFGEFIYFSPCLDSHGPRIKFYGGTKATSTTRKSPTMKFTKTGETDVEIYQWMDKKNCPNAFDSEYTNKVHNFIQKTLPILLLVWFEKLDEAWALEYFKGNINLKKLITYIIDIDDKHINNINNIEPLTLTKLHKYCLDNNLYKF